MIRKEFASELFTGSKNLVDIGKSLKDFHSIIDQFARNANMLENLLKNIFSLYAKEKFNIVMDTRGKLGDLLTTIGQKKDEKFNIEKVGPVTMLLKSFFYTQSPEKAKKETNFLKRQYEKAREIYRKKYRRRPRARIIPEEIIESSRSPELLRSEIEKIHRKYHESDEGLRRRMVDIALLLTRPEFKIYAKNCGDWLKRIACLAGAKRKNIYHDLSYAFYKIKNKKTGRTRYIWKEKSYDCGNNHISHEKLHRILKPGYVLWANGYNRYKGGNHAIMFLKWVSKDVALVVSNLGRGRHKVHYANLKKRPVVHIEKPTVA